MSETGAIKFTAEQIPSPPVLFPGFAELNCYREQLRQRKLMGVDESGIGFGNLSAREGATSRFYITGSGTGGKTSLGPADYARVMAFDFEKNWLRCEGATMASSESLTHAAIYRADSNVQAVIHCHATALWIELVRRHQATSSDVEYGTPEMAHAVIRLLERSDIKQERIFAMGGHRDGVISFGKNLADAFDTLTTNLNNLDPGSHNRPP